MSDIAIKVENISKLYQIGAKRSGSLRETLAHAFGRKSKEEIAAEEFWALKDVSFEIKPGEAVGIIGKNGAGKSTLLKVLSRITEPTKGRIEINGRVASLLEVGTGFHPELTGRENIFMNGTILGMTRREIKAKFDEIVDFSGVEKFIDTPVKHYSSGMYVRLAFAVAAHLEPEILIIDEVLAVGDAEFQKKCLGKMGEVAGQGRTVIFVSHNMTAVQSLCSQAIFLKNGNVSESGNSHIVINNYLNKAILDSLCTEWENEDIAPGNEFVKIKSVKVSLQEENVRTITVETPINIEFTFWNFIPNQINLSLVLWSLSGECIFNVLSPSCNISQGLYKGNCSIPGNFLNDNKYSVEIYFVKDKSSVLYRHAEICVFEVYDKEREGNWFGKWIGAVRPQLIFDLQLLEEKYYV